MKKSVIAIIVAVVAVGGIVAVVLANKSDDDEPANTATTTQQTGDQTSEQTGSPDAASSQPTTQAPASQATEVEIEDFSFKPQTITVKKGSKVTWTNKDTVKHNVAPDNASDAFKSGPLLAKGETYSVTFNTVGSFAYHCQPHPNMTGTVVVTE